MISTRFYLDCRRREKGSPAPLKISIFKDNVRALIPMNVFLTPEEWDAKRQRPISDELYAHIMERKSVIDAYIFKLETEGRLNGFKACQVKDLVINHFFGAITHEEKPKQNNFKMRYEKFTQSRPAAGTRDIYDRTWKKVEKFAKHKKFNLSRLTFEEITIDWLTEFDLFLVKPSPSKNARNIHLRNIRAVFNDALDDEVISCYPFRKFKIKEEETKKRCLTVENLRNLFDCKVERYAEFYKDMFKLTFFLIGINPVDLAHLKSITFDGRIEYRRAKTHRLYSLKVEPEAMEIIERWRGEKYLLSILDRWKNYKNFARQANIALQCMGAKRTGLGGEKGLGLFPEITMYWARHSWATIARKIGVSKDDIRLALGHGAKTVTDVYIDEDREKIDEANRKVIDWVLYGKK